MIKLTKEILESFYLDKGFSVAQIAEKFHISQNKVNYWLNKYNISKRSISDAVYLKHNPTGDPFVFKIPTDKHGWLLLGLGLGLYWGEGNKRSTSSVRLGNVDPKLIKVFIVFLEKIFLINPDKLKFGLQIFSDTSSAVAKNFWIKKIKVKSKQFYRVIVTPSHKPGTYKYKSKYGVLTVYFNNVKLQKSLKEVIENFPSM